MEQMLDKNEIVHQIRKWPPMERLNLISEIWDEIKEAKELISVSEDEKELLLDRLANFRANPESAVDWETLKRKFIAGMIKK